MKILKTLSVSLICAVLVLAPVSCVGPLPLAQGEAVKVEIQAQIKAGDISPELGAFLIAEIDKRMDPNSSGDIDWDLILKSLGGIGLAVVTSITGVRLTRGPAKPLDKSQAGLLKEVLAKAYVQKVDEARQQELDLHDAQRLSRGGGA